MSRDRKTVFVVTGMHRSGTSLLARGLLALGINLGDNLLEKSATENPTGYWEDVDILALSERVLKTLGRRWSSLEPLFAEELSKGELEPLIDDAAKLLSEKMRGHQTWGFKNPRTGPLLPFWTNVFERLCLDAKYLTIVRNPRNVVHSLQRRNKFARGYGYALWTTHYLDTIRNLSEYETVVVSYEDLMASPSHRLHLVAEQLNCKFNRDIESGIDDFATNFVSPDLNHFDSDLSELRSDTACFSETLELYDLLRVQGQAHDLKLTSESIEKCERINRTWRGRHHLLRSLDAHEAGVDLRLKQLDETTQSQHEHLFAQESLIQKLRTNIDAAEALATERSAALERATERESELRILLKNADEAALALNRNLFNATNILRTERTKLENIIEGYEKAVAGLLASSRWRTGNAIGEFKRKLLGRPHVPLATHFMKDLSVQFRDWQSRHKFESPILSRTSVPAGVRVLSGNRPAAVSQRTFSRSDDESGATRVASALSRLTGAPPVTVIVPIFNAAEDLRRCVQSLFRNTSMNATLCLINDASTDPAIAEHLVELAAIENIQVLTNEVNLGFTGTVNRGLKHTSGDVVLLNSDTVVGPRWLENLRFAAYSDETVGTVTAISDNAGAFSFPISGVKNNTPEALCNDDVARLAFQDSARIYPSVPTGNGFCLFIKRSVLERIGALDAENFPQGYGEENDFCMRAAEAGFRHLIDDSTYVFHREGSSFQGSRNALMKAGTKKINALYPDYNRLVANAFSAPALDKARQAIGSAFDTAAKQQIAVKPRVLFLAHQAEGGMNQTAADLVSGLATCYQSFVLLSDGKELTLLTFENGDLRKVAHTSLSEAIVDCRLPHAEYRQFFAEIIQEFRIEVVHMHHLLSSCLEICDVLRIFEIPLVLSLHDFFYVCPTVNLLDQDGIYCGGACTEGDGQCLVPFQNLATIPNLKHGWVTEWREQLGGLLDRADAIVAPSHHVAEIYRAAFPNLGGERLTVIEHGRDLEARGDCAKPPAPNTPARILVPGVISRHKGAAYIQQLAKLDRGERLEFHFLGRIPPELEGVGVEHGPYEVSEFPDRAREIGPSFVGLFSITAETYGHVMTEAWACGVPMLVLNIGTQADRAISKGGGWVLDRDDVNAAYRKILKICDHPEDYASQRKLASLDGLPDVTAMAGQYDLMYRRIQYARKNFRPRSGKPSAEHRINRPLKIGILPQRDDDTPISSSFIRLTLPLEHNLARSTIDTRVTAYPDIAAQLETYDAVIVQRTAIANGRANRFIDDCHSRQIPYILDIDDDLLSMGKEHAEYQIYEITQDDLTALIESAAKITLSTNVLAARYESVIGKTSVIPNALDEKIWFSPLTKSPIARDYDGIGLLYMGTETHAEDMKILQHALERLKSSPKVPDIRLFVIGGEPTQADQDWYTRIDVPLGCRRYPEFVSWLRGYSEYWDIGLAPLVDTMFNRAKSNLKYLEYSALGLPGIYADLPPYSETVRPRQTGFLAGAKPESWSAAIETLAVSGELRDDIANAARTDVLENHRLGDVAEKYADEIHKAVTRYRTAASAK